MIPVTKPFLPPKEKYEEILEGIWNRNWLTNNGPLVNELEDRLKEYLETDKLLFLSNGTIALQIALKALGLKGEIITTPFSYVATTSSIVWEGCDPIFVDIDPNTLNIDPNNIQTNITSKTKAILATHVYGNACYIEKINQIAKDNNLKVIYDAAHCFGTKYDGESIFKFGDISITSFHATKLFHTIEGGAIFTQNSETLQRIEYMRNFGHDGPEKFSGVGINGKNSEFHAAMGLIIFDYIQEILNRRKNQYILYKERLERDSIRFIDINPRCEFNYAYCPIIFSSEEVTLKVIKALNDNLIYPRRYFYPSLTKLGYTKSTNKVEVCDSISPRIICLPMYHELSDEEIEIVCKIINRIV